MTPDARFTHILSDLAMLGVTQGTAFGRRGISADGTVIACLLDDSMSFRLGADTPERASALALTGATPWDPGDRGHPLTDWVRVPQGHEEAWGRFAEVALHRLRHKL